MKLRCLFLIILLLATAPSAFAENPRRDGNWWRTLDKISKLYYVVGVFDGLELAPNYTCNDLIVKGQEDNFIICNSYNQTYDIAWRKAFSDVVNDQISDGLDSFYSDYKNRRILTYDAIALVLLEINGTDKKILDKVIESQRKITK